MGTSRTAGRPHTLPGDFFVLNSLQARCDSSTQYFSSGHRPSVGWRSFTVSVWNAVTGVQRAHSLHTCFSYSLLS